LITTISFSQTEDATFKTVQTYEIQEARQGIAVDSAYFYAINTKGIGKYHKKTVISLQNGRTIQDGSSISMVA